MIEECICAGVDGKCVLKTLDGHGVKLTSITHYSDELTYGDLVRLQKLLLNDVVENDRMHATEIVPRNFAVCVKEGVTDEVGLYLSASSSIGDLSTQTEKLLPQTPLTLASALGYLEIVIMLIEKGTIEIV